MQGVAVPAHGSSRTCDSMSVSWDSNSSLVLELAELARGGLDGDITEGGVCGKHGES